MEIHRKHSLTLHNESDSCLPKHLENKNIKFLLFSSFHQSNLTRLRPTNKLLACQIVHSKILMKRLLWNKNLLIKHFYFTTFFINHQSAFHHKLRPLRIYDIQRKIYAFWWNGSIGFWFYSGSLMGWNSSKFFKSFIQF